MSAKASAQALAARQVALDRARCRARPELLERKWARMAASPFAFLRGALPVFDGALRSCAVPPSFTATLVGDLHLENFGVLGLEPGRFLLHVNDFDETRSGPVAHDVLRLLTSVLLARESLGVDGREVQSLAEAALDGHQKAVSGKRQSPPSLLVAAVQDAEDGSRTFEKLIDPEARAIRRGPKTPKAPAALRRAVLEAMPGHVSRLTDEERRTLGRLEFLDAAWRVAGTGSLGLTRLVVLAEGRRGALWLFDVKACPRGAAEVVAALRSALPAPPFGLGAVQVLGRSMVARALMPGEAKLEAQTLRGAEQRSAIHHLGFLAGQVHARTATHARRFSAAERRALLELARHLAGLHHEVFLHFCAAVG
ncbi:MAG: DUF2252 domain-containing protein [Myxococcaceae bacterium]|nr:DUF2252 domain-containing protein [Myxococcaceae bacterium]